MSLHKGSLQKKNTGEGGGKIFPKFNFLKDLFKIRFKPFWVILDTLFLVTFRGGVPQILKSFEPPTILAFQLVPNSRYMFLILGSGVPDNRDPSLKLGSGDPETRYGFQRKNGLFLVLKTQKILKHNPKLYPLGIFSLAAFVLDLFMFCGFW